MAITYITAYQVCEFLGIEIETLDDVLHMPELRFPKPAVVRGRVLFVADDVTRWVAFIADRNDFLATGADPADVPEPSYTNED